MSGGERPAAPAPAARGGGGFAWRPRRPLILQASRSGRTNAPITGKVNPRRSREARRRRADTPPPPPPSRPPSFLRRSGGSPTLCSPGKATDLFSSPALPGAGARSDSVHLSAPFRVRTGRARSHAGAASQMAARQAAPPLKCDGSPCDSAQCALRAPRSMEAAVPPNQRRRLAEAPRSEDRPQPPPHTAPPGRNGVTAPAVRQS